MKLLVGLGNPGDKYARNRHNIGFMAVERIAERHRFSSWRRRFQGETSEGDIGGERIVLLKPATYMNESGRSVGEAARFLKITPADVVAFHDELDLVQGRLKVKSGGGNAGHNGLRSISQHMGNDYHRVRMGIGHPGHKDAVAGYVLHDFAKADQDWLRALLDAVADAVPHLVAGDAARFAGDVARLTGVAEPEPRKAPLAGKPAAKPPMSATSPVPAKPSPQPETPSGATSEPDAAAAPSSPPPVKARHPAGERASKRQSALAENLRKWMARRPPGSDTDSGTGS